MMMYAKKLSLLGSSVKTTVLEEFGNTGKVSKVTIACNSFIIISEFKPSFSVYDVLNDF